MLRMDREAALDLLDETSRLVGAAEGTAKNDPTAANAYAHAAIARALSALTVAIVIHTDESAQH